MKKKKPLPTNDVEFDAYLKRYIVATLRRGTLYWPYRNDALKASRVDRGLYKCHICTKAFPKKEVRLDHVIPVVRLSGFTNWDDYLKRMFPKTEGFQVLCLECNKTKTDEENVLRKIHRKSIKKVK